MKQEWCESRGKPPGCHVPTAAERDAPDVGNSFLTTANESSAVAFANFTARTVATTVATLCAAAKDVSNGKLFTSAFYGYIINVSSQTQSGLSCGVVSLLMYCCRLQSAVNIQFAGHAALEFLLNHDAIDAIDSPILYRCKLKCFCNLFAIFTSTHLFACELWVHSDRL